MADSDVGLVLLLWFNFCLSNQSQSFCVDGVHSRSIIVDCSVLLDYVLGPLESITYTENVLKVFDCNLGRHHLLSDDKQLYRSDKISDLENIRKRRD